MKEFKDKLIEMLEEYHRESENDYLGLGCEDDRGAMNAYGHAIQIVNELAEEYKGGWIACSDRKPKYLEKVLVCTESGGRTIAYMQGEIYGNSWCDGYGMIGDVIAWMPLPAPFKEGE